MGNDIVGNVPAHLVPVYGNGSLAHGATTIVCMGIIHWIGRKVPEQYVLAPVAGHIDDHPFYLGANSDLPTPGIFNHHLLGKIQILVRSG